MPNLNSLLHGILYGLLLLSGSTIFLLVFMLGARLRKKDYRAPKKVATWAAIATSVGSFAIGALNVKIPIGILPESDPAYETIKNYFSAIQGKECSNAWGMIHAARKKELKDKNKDFDERQFCESYSTTLTYENLDIQRQNTKNDGVSTRIYRVAYDVWDELPRNDLYDLRLKDYRDVLQSKTYDENKLTSIILNNLRLYFVIPADFESKIADLIANTPFWSTASPEFIEEIKRLLNLKYKIDLEMQKTPPPYRRVERHYVHNLTMMLERDTWRIRDGLAAPILVTPYVPRDRIL
jgi:hypothetical protein